MSSTGLNGGKSARSKRSRPSVTKEGAPVGSPPAGELIPAQGNMTLPARAARLFGPLGGVEPELPPRSAELEQPRPSIAQRAASSGTEE